MAEENESNVYRAGRAIVLATVPSRSGCHKRAAPAPPPAAVPTASISVNPNSIQAGQSATLMWQTTDAADVSIDGIGAIQENGSQSVSPTESTTYHLTPKGSGGTQEATSRLTVVPPAAPPLASLPTATDEDLYNRRIKDVYFDYDESVIRGDQQTLIATDAAFLNAHTGLDFTVDGHCDERGSTEYNLALGDQRASAIKNALAAASVSASRIRTISYGKERPFCCESSEACWQQNRRGHFVYQK